MQNQSGWVKKLVLGVGAVGVVAIAFGVINVQESLGSMEEDRGQLTRIEQNAQAVRENIALKEEICLDLMDDRLTWDEALDRLMEIDGERLDVRNALSIKYGDGYQVRELLAFRLRDQIQCRLENNPSRAKHLISKMPVFQPAI